MTTPNPEHDDNHYREHSPRNSFNLQGMIFQGLGIVLRTTAQVGSFLIGNGWKYGGQAASYTAPHAKKGLTALMMKDKEDGKGKRFRAEAKLGLTALAVGGMFLNGISLIPMAWVGLSGLAWTAWKKPKKGLAKHFDARAAGLAALAGLFVAYHTPRAVLYHLTDRPVTFYTTGQNDDPRNIDNDRYIITAKELPADFPDLTPDTAEGERALRDAASRINTSGSREFEIEYSWIYPIQLDPSEDQWGKIPTESAICEARSIGYGFRGLKWIPGGLGETLTLRPNFHGPMVCRSMSQFR